MPVYERIRPASTFSMVVFPHPMSVLVDGVMEYGAAVVVVFDGETIVGVVVVVVVVVEVVAVVAVMWW